PRFPVYSRNLSSLAKGRENLLLSPHILGNKHYTRWSLAVLYCSRWKDGEVRKWRNSINAVIYCLPGASSWAPRLRFLGSRPQRKILPRRLPVSQLRRRPRIRNKRRHRKLPIKPASSFHRVSSLLLLLQLLVPMRPFPSSRPFIQRTAKTMSRPSEIVILARVSISTRSNMKSLSARVWLRKLSALRSWSTIPLWWNMSTV